jgi:hypothetical protein
MRSRLARTVLEKVTKAGMRHRQAQASHRSKMGRCVGGISEAEQVAQGLFELPAVENRPLSAQRVEQVELGVAEVVGILHQGPAGVL